MNLNSKLNSVESRDDFIAFIKALRNDLVSNPEEWENLTLSDFLESLSAWVQDMDGYYQNNSRPVPKSFGWKNLAEMLLAAKYYE